MADEQRYLAYLVRLWAVHDNGDVVWRASAENAHTGDRLAFGDVESLCCYLKAMAAAAPVATQSELKKTISDKV